MMKRIASTLTLALAVTLAGTASAGIENAGTTAANFLTVGSGAGILGMGGATLGWGADLNAASWNAAALGQLDGTQMVFSHSGLSDQTAQEWAAVGGRILRGQNRWAVTALYHGDGSIDGRDASGLSTGSFGVSRMAFGATLARPYFGIATVGLGAKFVSEKLGDVSGVGGTFDAGVLVRTGPYGIGAAAQNVGGRMTYGSTFYKLPTNYGIGASYDHVASGVRVALDLNFPSAYYSDVRTGIEWRWKERLALRTGYRHEFGGAPGEPLNGPTFGMGAGTHGMWVDYGYIVGGNGQGQHRLGISFRPGGMLGGDESAALHSTNLPIAGPPGPVKKSVSASARKSVESVKASKPVESEPAPKPQPAIAAPKPIEPVSAPKSVEVAPSPRPSVAVTAPSEVAQAPKRIETPPAPKPARVIATTPAPTSVTPATPAPATASAPAPIAIAAPVTPPAPAVSTPPAASATSVKPVATATAQVAPARVPRPAKVKVKSGETMYSIAQRYGITAAAIMMENNMVNDRIHSGQVLKLPAN